MAHCPVSLQPYSTGESCIVTLRRHIDAATRSLPIAPLLLASDLAICSAPCAAVSARAGAACRQLATAAMAATVRKMLELNSCRCWYVACCGICSSCNSCKCRCNSWLLQQHKRGNPGKLLVMTLTLVCLEDVACKLGRPEGATTPHCRLGGDTAGLPLRPGLDRVCAAQPHLRNTLRRR